MLQHLTNILKSNGLSVTEPRKKILELFLSYNGALDHAAIEKGADNLDRVTIYRTLQAFVERGIIHTIPTVDNSVKYALCKECGQGHHHDNHVHFICEKCGTTTCIEDVSVPQISLPGNYHIREKEMILKGECESCYEI